MLYLEIIKNKIIFFFTENILNLIELNFLFLDYKIKKNFGKLWLKLN
jgi:hypothetical protein